MIIYTEYDIRINLDKVPEIKILKIAKENKSDRTVFSFLTKELWNQCNTLDMTGVVLVRKLVDGRTKQVIPNSLCRIVLERLYDANPEGAREKKTRNRTWYQTCTMCARKFQPRRGPR